MHQSYSYLATHILADVVKTLKEFLDTKGSVDAARGLRRIERQEQVFKHFTAVVKELRSLVRYGIDKETDLNRKRQT